MAPDTIVLIHGFWVTPRSWEDWKAHYESKGYRVLAPAYPGFDVEVEALNADTTPIEQLKVPEIIERLEGVIGELDSPPILIGHSAGGVFTQILLDHGFGAVGVAVNSAPTEGVKRIPLSQVRASFPVLKNPANRHKAVGLTFEQWNYAFTNGFPEDEARRLYERYHVPASGEVFWGSALANIHPGKDDNWVNYKNTDRAPLLFISGSDDHLMPPSIQQSNAKHYNDEVVTEIEQFEGRTCCPRGRAGSRSPTTPSTGRCGTRRSPRDRRPHHAHRRSDRADRGRRLAAADRPDVRRPRPQVQLRLGDVVAQGRRTGDRRGRAAADRRGAAQPRPPRRQSRRRGARAAAAGGHGRDDGVGRAAAGRQRPRPRSLADHPPRGAGPAGDRDHRYAVPPRPAAQPPAGRRRDRLLAALGRGERRAVDLRRHRALQGRA